MSPQPIDGVLRPERDDLPPGELSLATVDPAAGSEAAQPVSGLLTATYWGVFFFCAVYFFRPGDLSSALAVIPLAKITGGMAVVCLGLALLAGAVRLTPEIKLLAALFGWVALSVPFSTWPGGSFEFIFVNFLKLVIAAVAVMVAVNSWDRLRGLMKIQAVGMVLMACLSFGGDRIAGRMYGFGAMYGDPNDLALNLCVVLPFCVVLMRGSSTTPGKAFWGACVLITLVSIVATFSRGGFLALLALLLLMWRRFKPKFSSLVAVVLLFAIAAGAALVVIGPAAYFERMQTIWNPAKDVEGSAQIRRELLLSSIDLSVKHPLFGVGPGQFPQISGLWFEAHNTYTQFSAEAGLVALVLFLLLLKRTMRNLRWPKGSSGEQPGADLANALFCATGAYAVGTFFLSTGFLLLPYLLIAYAAAVRQIRENQCPVVPGSAGQELQDGTSGVLE